MILKGYYALRLHSRHSLCLIIYLMWTALLDMHYLTCGISYLLRSINLNLFTFLLIHPILRYHLISHHLRSHQFYAYSILRILSYTVFLVQFRLPLRILNLNKT